MSPNGVLVPVVVLTALLLVSLVLAVGFGHAAIAPSETLRFLGAGVLGGTVTENELTPYTVVWEIRAPRAVLAALLGAGLAVTGVVMQVLVRNALADPFILGISSGRRLTFAPFPARLHGRPHGRGDGDHGDYQGQAEGQFPAWRPGIDRAVVTRMGHGDVGRPSSPAGGSAKFSSGLVVFVTSRWEIRRPWISRTRS